MQSLPRKFTPPVHIRICKLLMKSIISDTAMMLSCYGEAIETFFSKIAQMIQLKWRFKLVRMIQWHGRNNVTWKSSFQPSNDSELDKTQFQLWQVRVERKKSSLVRMVGKRRSRAKKIDQRWRGVRFNVAGTTQMRWCIRWGSGDSELLR